MAQSSGSTYVPFACWVDVHTDRRYARERAAEEPLGQDSSGPARPMVPEFPVKKTAGANSPRRNQTPREVGWICGCVCLTLSVDRQGEIRTTQYWPCSACSVRCPFPRRTCQRLSVDVYSDSGVPDRRHGDMASKPSHPLKRAPPLVIFYLHFCAPAGAVC